MVKNQISADGNATNISISTISTEKIFIENTNICIAPKKQDIIDYIKNNNITDLYLFSEDTINKKNIMVKQFYLIDYNSVYLLSKQKKFHLYENYEENEKVKLFIDIDIKKYPENINKNEYFDDIINESITLFTDKLKEKDIFNSEIIILKSSSENKLSAHVIFNNVIFEDIYHMKHFLSVLNNTELIKKDIIDTNVYKGGCFRLLWNSKLGKNINLEYYKSINYKYTTDKQLFYDCLLKNIPETYHFVNIKKDKKKSDKKLDENKKLKEKAKKKIIDSTINLNTCNEIINNFTHTFYNKKEFIILIKFFDECYDKERFTNYNDWIKVGMAIKNIFSDNGFELYDYFSSKGANYEGTNNTLKKFSEFSYIPNNGYTISTLYNIASEDNKDKYSEIIKKESLFKDFDLTSTGIAHYIKYLKPNDFIWKDNCLYCFNGKFWERDDTIMRIYIGNELYEFLKNTLISCFWNDKNFHQYKTKLEKLRSISFKKEIIETTKEVLTNNNIEFDSKFYLFGFNNMVYDLNENKFREYKYDDYISITCGYDWIDAKREDIIFLQNMLDKIFPDKEEQNVYLTICSTGLEGRCLEKFTIANGNGRNGKGVLNDLLLECFGKYGMTANNAILFETNKTGTNPEKNNIDRKRFIIFREPPEKYKFENSVVKELTGGGNFSARGHFESATEKKLYCTVIVECNKKPQFSEEATNADLERLIDIKFCSTFTEDNKLIDESKYIFKGDKFYKTNEFKNKYKFALLSILFNKYKVYKDDKYNLILPKSIKFRSESYLQSSCNILTWFNQHYGITDDKNDIIKIKDIFEQFKSSEYYDLLNKNEKRKYNYTYFNDYFSNNIFLNKYFIDCSNLHKPNYITNYKFQNINFDE